MTNMIHEMKMQINLKKWAGLDIVPISSQPVRVLQTTAPLACPGFDRFPASLESGLVKLSSLGYAVYIQGIHQPWIWNKSSWYILFRGGDSRTSLAVRIKEEDSFPSHGGGPALGKAGELSRLDRWRSWVNGIKGFWGHSVRLRQSDLLY